MKSEIRLAISTLTDQPKVFTGKMREKGNSLVCSGIKTDVTEDFLFVSTRYFGKPEKLNKKIETEVNLGNGEQYVIYCKRVK